MARTKRVTKQEPASQKKKKYEQSSAEDADELLGGSDSDSSASKDKLDYLQSNPCDKVVRCACFLCRQSLLVDKDRLRYVMRKKDNEIDDLRKEIKKLKSKK